MLAEFAERFTQLRQNLGYTQQKAAEKLGVTPQAVSKWENGTSLPDVEMIREIARLMDCTTDYLLGHQALGTSHLDLEAVQRKTEIENIIQKDILTLEVGIGLVNMLIEENKNHYVQIHNLRVLLGDRMGIVIPTIRLRDNVSLKEKEYRILLHGRKVLGQGCMEYPLYFYVPLQQLPTADWRTFWAAGEWKEKQAAIPKEYREYSAMDCITAHLSEVILQHYGEILNRQIVSDLVDMVRRRYPAAVDGVVPEKVSLGLLQRVLAGLVTAGVPINRLDYIIGYLEEHPMDAAADPDAALDALKHQLS